MSDVIGIVNYGVAGNIFSIEKALQKVAAKTAIVESAEDLSKVDKLVIPGVGSFKDAVQELHDDGLFNPLAQAIQTKPTMGICLGMQILAEIGFEYGMNKGLGAFNAEVKKMQCSGTVPHMGFNRIKVQKPSALLSGVEDESFYFMHSYEVVNYTDILALSEHFGHQFVSAMAKDHIFGVQFHPEKSRDAGLEVFKNFVGM